MADLRCYAPLAKLWARQGITAASSDDGRYMDKLRAATEEIENYTQRFFQPVQDTHDFDWKEPLRLWFRSHDLLSCTSITDGSGSVIPSNSWILLGGNRSTSTSVGPFYGVELDPTLAFFLWQTTPRRALKVNGVWGYHTNYANAWHDTTLTLNGGINASATTINTTGNPTTATDSWGQTPALSPGNLIQVDSEWMQVITTASASITVIRGQNGTTAASHNTAVSISVYEAPRNIQDICLRWAAYLFAQDSVDFKQTVMPAMGAMTVPAGVPNDIYAALDRFARLRVA